MPLNQKFSEYFEELVEKHIEEEEVKIDILPTMLGQSHYKILWIFFVDYTKYSCTSFAI